MQDLKLPMSRRPYSKVAPNGRRLMEVDDILIHDDLRRN